MKTEHLDDGATHLFALGNSVRISRSASLLNTATGPYEVVGQLPERDGQLQYRIKSSLEPYYRVAKQSDLESNPRQGRGA